MNATTISLGVLYTMLSLYTPWQLVDIPMAFDILKYLMLQDTLKFGLG